MKKYKYPKGHVFLIKKDPLTTKELEDKSDMIISSQQKREIAFEKMRKAVTNYEAKQRVGDFVLITNDKKVENALFVLHYKLKQQK